nr:toprim domain-containing protein [uncultured Roseococcus sp.]
MSAHEAKPGFWIGDSIPEILGANRIVTRGKRLIAGRDVKVLCPACNGGREREQSLSVKLDVDEQGVTWHCKRGTCSGFTGSGKIDGARRGDDGPQRRERPTPVRPQADPPQVQQQTQNLLDWFALRGISEETVREFGIYGKQDRWPKFGDDGKLEHDAEGKALWIPKPTIVFPYLWRGELVNRKRRSVDKQFMQDKDSLRSLYNADNVTSPDEVIFVEGEMDVLSLWEAGFRQVVSLPDGASNTLREENDPRRQDDIRFDPLENCSAIIAPVKRCILATDADVPGGYLAEEFARRLGRVRCWKASWPEGCKDANDVLLRHVPKGEVPTDEQLELGRADLRAAITGAEPWPLAHVVTLRPGQLSHFLRSGKGPRGLDSGIRTLDDIARLPAGPGWLVEVTGIPSHGKTSMVRPWLIYQARKHNLGLVWCSPEDNQAETSALEMARIIAGQPLYEAGTYMPEEVLSDAEDWLRRHVTFLQSNDPNVEMSLQWVLERAEEAKARHPRQLLVIDPWNEFEHQFDRYETETQYVGRWLRKLKAWGRAEGMTIVIVAHPKNQLKDGKGKYPVVDGYDINGGANWNNKADLGLTVYRAEDGFVQVHCWKARFPAFGKRGGMARLSLDKRTGRLGSVFQNQDEQPSGAEAWG